MEKKNEEVVLTDENLNYLRKAARVMKCSISDYVNWVVREDRKREVFDCLKN